jgi:membrane protease YdiL (CAAX protease family)
MSFAFPIVEEVIFRAMIQQGLYRGFVRALPSLVTLSPHLKAAFGGATEEKVAQVGSILFSSLLFGLVHAFNHPQQPVKATFHCVHTATNSALFLGPLYHQHGLWASSLAHIVQNTFCRFLFELSLSR